MESLLVLASKIVNFLHDLILFELHESGTFISDKELHFWVFGLIGMIIFFGSNAAFKYLRRWGLSAVSFVFTGMVLTILAVGIEIEQYITGRGKMETLDVLAGVAGFLALFAVYWVIVGIWRLLLRFARKSRRRDKAKIRHR